MAKSADKAYGAESRGSSTMMFDADKLKIITDKKDKKYDSRVEKPLDESLIASIMSFGVRDHINVWKDPETGDIIVLDGKQRRQNTIEANKRLAKQGKPKRQIPGVVCKGTWEQALATMVILNEGRQETSSMEKAHLAERLLGAGYTEPEVGVILHLKPGSLRNYMSLLECTSVVRTAVETGEILPTDAYRLSKLEPAEQKETLAKMLGAAKGVKGKKRRAKKMRAASGVLKMRTRKEVEGMIAKVRSLFGPSAKTTVALLEWVLGGTEPSLLGQASAPETAPETPAAIVTEEDHAAAGVERVLPPRSKANETAHV